MRREQASGGESACCVSSSGCSNKHVREAESWAEKWACVAGLKTLLDAALPAIRRRLTWQGQHDSARHESEEMARGAHDVAWTRALASSFPARRMRSALCVWSAPHWQPRFHAAGEAEKVTVHTAHSEAQVSPACLRSSDCRPVGEVEKALLPRSSPAEARARVAQTKCMSVAASRSARFEQACAARAGVADRPGGVPRAWQREHTRRGGLLAAVWPRAEDDMPNCVRP